MPTRPSFLALLWRHDKGTALVEFAITFPVLLLLYLGVFVCSDVIACNRKVTITTRALTDLATRYSALSQTEATNILNGSAQVISPYSSDNAVIVLSEVKVTDSTHATVIWSKALNGTARTANSTVTVPTGMVSTDTFMIMGEVRYTYTPAVPFATGGFNLSDTILMLPRISDEIPLS